MPDTGAFYVLDIDAVTRPDGAIDAVRFISVRCNACQEVTNAEADTLDALPGGTVLACAGCGARQAVSNARLVECEHHLAAGVAPRGQDRRRRRAGRDGAGGE